MHAHSEGDEWFRVDGLNFRQAIEAFLAMVQAVQDPYAGQELRKLIDTGRHDFDQMIEDANAKAKERGEREDKIASERDGIDYLLIPIKQFRLVMEGRPAIGWLTSVTSWIEPMVDGSWSIGICRNPGCMWSGYTGRHPQREEAALASLGLPVE